MNAVQSTRGRHSPRGARKSKTRRRERLVAVSFLLPAVILVGGLIYVPMGRAVYDSFFATTMFSPQPQFVGFEQYKNILGSSTFWTVVRNSLVWTVSVVLLQNVAGLAIAVLLNQNLRLLGLTRTLLLLPWVLPGVVAALLWRFMYDPQLGLINALLNSAGIISKNIAWLGEPTTAMAAVIVAALWKGFPFSMVVYLAALQTVDQDQVEAAMIDGAKAWQRFRYVVVPSIAGIIRLNLLLTTIFTFNYFDLIWVSTQGGPLDSTHIFPTYIFQLGFGEFQYGDASVYGVIAALMLVTVAILYIRELRPEGAR
jgi:multiple sugar transport system permease protein